jgi:hypothetical protein
VTSLGDLTQNQGERHLVYGGTRTGKSSFMDWNIRHIQRERPSAMMLLADTKPRFRAETISWGPGNKWRRDAAKAGIYDTWAAGPVLPNSVVVPMDRDHPFRGMWDADKRPGEIAIMQSGQSEDWKRMLELMKHFVDRGLKNRERLIAVDEGLDFYQRNTLGIDPRRDVILHVARAGGERNIGLLFGAHRPHGIPPLLNTLSSRVTLFYLKFARDMHYLWEMGVPAEDIPPRGNYIFRQYQVAPGGVVEPGIDARLDLPDQYLKQLAAT